MLQIHKQLMRRHLLLVVWRRRFFVSMMVAVFLSIRVAFRVLMVSVRIGFCGVVMFGRRLFSVVIRRALSQRRKTHSATNA